MDITIIKRLISNLRRVTSSSEGITGELREVLLQDQHTPDDSHAIVVEAVEIICTELRYGDPSESWRIYGYCTLWDLARTDNGLKAIEMLEIRGRLITLLVRQFTTSSVPVFFFSFASLTIQFQCRK